MGRTARTPPSASSALLFRKLLTLPKLEKFPQYSFTGLPGIVPWVGGKQRWTSVLWTCPGGDATSECSPVSRHGTVALGTSTKDTERQEGAASPPALEEAARPTRLPSFLGAGDVAGEGPGPPCRSPAAAHVDVGFGTLCARARETRP